MSLKSLRRKLPGMDGKIGRMVADMANHEFGPQFHGWIDIRPADPRDDLDAYAGTHWIAFLHVSEPGGAEYRVPVVLDPKQVVSEDTKPDVFLSMNVAEAVAKAQLPGFVAHIKDMLRQNSAVENKTSESAGPSDTQ